MTPVERAASVAVSSPFWCGPGRGMTGQHRRFDQGLSGASACSCCPSRPHGDEDAFFVREAVGGGGLGHIQRVPKVVRHHVVVAKVKGSAVLEAVYPSLQWQLGALHAARKAANYDIKMH